MERLLSYHLEAGRLLWHSSATCLEEGVVVVVVVVEGGGVEKVESERVAGR